MALQTSFTDESPGGDSTTPKTGDLSAVVTAGHTNASVRITNTGEDTCNFNYRDTGTTTFFLNQLAPGTSIDIEFTLTAARSIEYYFNISSLKVDVIDSWGSGLTSTVSLSDIENELTDYGYTVSETGDITSASVQRSLDRATSEVTPAATKYVLIAMQTLNADWKNTAIKKGAVAHALYKLRNKGAAQGRTTSQAIGVSNSTIDDLMADYRVIVERISTGIFYGA